MRTARAFVFGAFAVGAAACSDFATAPDRYPIALEVTPDTVLLNQGDTVSFRLTVLDQNGEAFSTLPSWAPPYWSSLNASLLEVSDGGIARALRPGESRVVAELAGLQARGVVQANPLELYVATGFVYLTQSVQRKGGGVPLIAARDGLLRVYVIGDGPNFFAPRVRATFYRDGAVTHSETAEADGLGIPQEVDEGDLALSYDLYVPGSVIQPGTSMVVEVDPDGHVPATAGSQLRVPETGELALDVREVRPFRLRLVPVHQSHNGINSSLELSDVNRVMRLAYDLYPFAEFDVDVRAAYTTSARLDTDDGWYQLIEEIALLRIDDNSPRYYYGGFSRPAGSTILGLGYLGYPVAIGDETRNETIAHEVGHNLNLRHAPCGGPSGVDPDFPYRDGTIGRYGYDRDQERVLPPETYDLMSYCSPVWISDYNYQRVIEYRDTSQFDAAFEDAATGRTRAPTTDVLVIQGGVYGGSLRLGPALATTAPVRLPQVGGRYTLEGLDRAGLVLFSLSLEPRPLDHGGTTFLVSIPTEMAEPTRLETLRLTGPEGVVERSRSPGPAAAPPELTVAPDPRAVFPEARWDATAYALAVARDRDTGEIVAMARDGQLVLPTGDLDRLDVVLSDGVEGHRATVVRR